MSAVKERLRKQALGYQLFTLGRNAVHTTKLFKSTPGGVLLATGAAWEGFDFPGDCVSLLVIPRLPFPIPDALKEKELERYPSLQSFLRAVVVPEMPVTQELHQVEAFIRNAKPDGYFQKGAA